MEDTAQPKNPEFSIHHNSCIYLEEIFLSSLSLIIIAISERFY